MKYPKMNTLWKRTEGKGAVIMPGDYSQEEFGNIFSWEVTEKIHGMNMRVIYTKDGVEIRGKSDKAQIPGELLGVMTKIFTEEKMAGIFNLEIADTVILFGEGYGKGIQKGGVYCDDQSFILFDINIDGVWFESEKVSEYALKLGINRVPILGHMTIDTIINFVRSRPDSRVNDKGITMEGVVCRSAPLMLDRMGKRIIFKLKCKDYTRLEAMSK